MTEQLHGCGHPLSAHNADGRCMGNVGGRPCTCDTDALAWRYMVAERIVVVSRVVIRDETAAGVTAARETGEPAPVVPDRITAVQAWRAWAWDCDLHHGSSCGDARLRSVTQTNVAWPPNAALEAVCGHTKYRRTVEQQRADAEALRARVDGRQTVLTTETRVYLDPALNVGPLAVAGERERVETTEIVIREPEHGHVVPDEGCSCGVYAHKSRRWIVDNYDREIICVVALWGKVIDAERGYRATFAKPVMLAVAGAALRERVKALYTDCVVVDRAMLRGTPEIISGHVDAPNPAAAEPIDWSEAFLVTIRAFLVDK